MFDFFIRVSMTSGMTDDSFFHKKAHNYTQIITALYLFEFE